MQLIILKISVIRLFRSPPALCPVKVKSDVLKTLKGLRVTGKAQLYGEHGRLIKEETGEIQFTENSLSGICVFNLSLFAKQNDKIVLDLLPDYSENELIKIIRQHILLFSDLPCEQLLTGIFQKRIGQAILKISRVDLSKICSKLSKDEVSGICKTIKSMSFTVSGKEDFSHAQCALGGVLGKEIDESTMMSKIVKIFLYAVRQLTFAVNAEGLIFILHLPAELLQEKIYDQSEQYTFKP